ncbi:MAG: helix-turn-helix domain-containing protein [Nitrospirae bacterium]|nr:helix-turn-helix domain-containing protein [Nitrospirota bacterium]
MDSFVSPEKQERIKQAFKELGTHLLTPVKERLGEEYSYEELRLIRATMARKGEE